MPADVEVDDDDDDERREAQPAVSFEEAEEDPAIKAQREKALAEREKLKQAFETKLFATARSEDARKYANDLFKEGKLAEAAAAYERILRLEPPLPPPDRAKLHANVAAVRVKQWRWPEALAACDAVLAIEPQHPKAIFRQAQAHRGLRNFEAALEAIARAKELTGGLGTAELNELEKHVRKDIAKVEAAAAEKAAALARAAQRERAKHAKEEAKAAEVARRAAARKAAADGNDSCPRPLPAGPASEGGASRDLSSWLRSDLLTFLTRDEGRLIFMEEDGWCSIREILPRGQLQAEAAILTASDGKRSLFYDISVTALCQVAQFRHREGAIGFDAAVTVSNVDSMTSVDEWMADARLWNSGSYPAKSRTGHMMDTYVKPRYLPHIKAEIEECLSRLHKHALKVLQAESSDVAMATELIMSTEQIQ